MIIASKMDAIKLNGSHLAWTGIIQFARLGPGFRSTGQIIGRGPGQSRLDPFSSIASILDAIAIDMPEARVDGHCN